MAHVPQVAQPHWRSYHDASDSFGTVLDVSYGMHVLLSCSLEGSSVYGV